MVFKLNSFALLGIQAINVTIEVHISNGIPSFTIVGLPDKSINESKQRVRAAILSSGYKFPTKRIIINLSPADIRKVGAFYDMPIAIAILAASEQISFISPTFIKSSSFIGELSLDGRLNPVRGIISMVETAADTGKNYFFIPCNNEKQAKVIKKISIISCKDLNEAIKIISDEALLKKKVLENNSAGNIRSCVQNKKTLDFKDIRGQLRAKRAVEVAVSGMHNIMLIGPPGSGKTMIAQRITGIMADLNQSESIEVTKIYSLIKTNEDALNYNRPFRNPHHTISRMSFIGGGITPRPGEISLAHRGVLFLDEFPLFRRELIEDLRQPVENRNIIIARNNHFYRFPCNFMLVVAMNPCYCGYLGDRKKRCNCSIREIKRYWESISGPILDRIDIRVDVPRPENKDYTSDASIESSLTIKKRVSDCIEVQRKRFNHILANYNSEVDFSIIQKWINENKEVKDNISGLGEKYDLTGRGISSLIKVSRTISDMTGSEKITEAALMEAINYRVSFNHEYFK